MRMFVRRSVTWPVRVVRARPRLFICLALGILAGFVSPSDWRVITRVLVGWNFGIFLYLAAVAVMVAAGDRSSIARRAAEQDDGRITMLTLTIVAAAAAFGAIFYQLLMVKDVHGLPRAFHLLLAAATVTSAWTFIHVMFALHYANECFSERALQNSPAAKAHSGLRFPGDETPDYFDFFYFSFVIGVACATADVNITSRIIRRTATIHSVVAFFFNSAVLALTINIAAGLAG
jgi:uncharacterized membrane protein